MDATTIWRRRVILMVVVGLVVAIPLTLLLRDDDEPEAEPERPSLAQRFPLNPPVGDSEIEASYRVPKRWKLDREGGAVTLRAPDDSVQVGITSPGPSEDSQALLDQALASLKATYDDVEVSPGSGKKVGGLPARGAVVSARNGKTELRILVAVSEGKKRAYLVQVFTAAGAEPRRVAEAQRFLDSLEYQG